MAERSSTKYNSPNIYPSFNDQQFRSNKISKVRDYFIGEVKERELMSKRLNKYITYFDYFDNSLIVLSATTGTISTASFATVIGAPVGIASWRFSLAFSISTGIVEKLLKQQEIKRKSIMKLLC